MLIEYGAVAMMTWHRTAVISSSLDAGFLTLLGVRIEVSQVNTWVLTKWIGIERKGCFFLQEVHTERARFTEQGALRSGMYPNYQYTNFMIPHTFATASQAEN